MDEAIPILYLIWETEPVEILFDSLKKGNIPVVPINLSVNSFPYYHTINWS